MTVADENTLTSVVSFLERQKLEYSTAEEQYCDKLSVRSSTQLAYVSVFNTAKIVVAGKESPLRNQLAEMATAIEAGQSIVGQALPFEIDKFPETIRERVPDCDPIIVRFLEEAIRCVRADALPAAAFMIGAASEKAINALIIAYTESIADETNRQRFETRVNNRMISKRYDEFTRSHKSCKNKTDRHHIVVGSRGDIGSMFQFCRITRNEVGHPQIVPDLDRGVIIANLGQFVTYIERVYGLSSHFRQNEVVL